MNLDPTWLFLSLFSSGVGFVLLVYGKKQQSFSAMVGGILMIGVSYFIGSALVMSLVSLAIIGTVYWLTRRGY